MLSVLILHLVCDNKKIREQETGKSLVFQAAWGGSVLVSKQHRHLMKGVERCRHGCQTRVFF